MKKLSVIAALFLASSATSALADEKIRINLVGYQEVPIVSTPGNGRFEATINRDGTEIAWSLTYADMQSDVTQAHIHIAQRGVNGGIVLWMCRTTQAAPAGTQTCPGLRAGTVSGVWTAADVMPQAAQGIAAMELGEVIAAMRARLAYANVHTVQSGGGEIRAQVRTHHGHGRGHGHDRDD